MYGESINKTDVVINFSCLLLTEDNYDGRLRNRHKERIFSVLKNKERERDRPIYKCKKKTNRL